MHKECSDDTPVNTSGQSMRRKGQDKRQRLVRATAELLRLRSVSQLKTAEIAREAGTSAPNFYLYFSCVIDAILAAVEQVSMSNPQILALIQASWTPSDLDARVHAFVHAYIAHWQSQGHLLRVRSVLVAEGDARFREAEKAASLDVLLALATKFVRSRPDTDGKMAATATATATAGVMLAMLDRLASYLPEASDGHAVTADGLINAAIRIMSLAIRDARGEIHTALPAGQ